MLGNLARRFTAFFLCTAFSCAVIPAPTGIGDTAQETRYENAVRTYYERFSSGRWQGAQIAPRSPLESEKRRLLEKVSVDVHDCSNEQYKCIFGSYRVFAVPRGKLSPSAAYVTAGSAFHVEECFRGDATTCQVALISSDCQQHSGIDACMEADGGRTRSPNPGPVLYFIFNTDFGVTAYGSVASPAQTADERRTAAVQMILQGRQGLLSK